MIYIMAIVPVVYEEGRKGVSTSATTTAIFEGGRGWECVRK